MQFLPSVLLGRPFPLVNNILQSHPQVETHDLHTNVTVLNILLHLNYDDS